MSLRRQTDRGRTDRRQRDKITAHVAPSTAVGRGTGKEMNNLRDRQREGCWRWLLEHEPVSTVGDVTISHGMTSAGLTARRSFMQMEL